MDPPTTNKAASSAESHTAGTPDAAQDQKRRSSSRSIKRKRFDDEIVEYSLGLPPAQVHRLGGRARTQSQTFVAVATAPATATSTATSSASSATGAAAVIDSINTSSPAPIATSVTAQSPQPTAVSIALTAIVTPATASGATQPRVTATFAPNPAIVAASTTVAAPVSAAVVAAAALLTTPAAAATSSNTTSTISAVLSNASGPQSATMSAMPEKRRAPKGGAISAAAAGGVSVTYASSAVTSATAALSGAVVTSAAPGGPSASKKAKRSRIGQQISTKDLGRWKPIDDLALILGVQQTNDLRMVHRGIKFSCKFTVQELQSRWYSLMYEETISRLAVAAMRNLHPELVEAVQAKALYTTQEEELLGGIKSTESPSLEMFQDLLDKNALVFYSARTAKALSTHWQLMKQYALLPDQQSQLTTATVIPSTLGSVAPGDGAKLMTFAEAEEQLNDTELLGEPRDDTVELELTLADRCNKKEIRMLENELTRWTVLVDSLTGIGFMPEFDNQTLAVLRGRLVRYLMRSREISFGRTTKDQAVDVDLSLEGPAHKASRRQGTIKLRSNGDFFIVNEGKRPLFIDGAPLLQGNKGRLSNNTIIEMAGLRFIFLINSDLINAIRQESAKMSGPLS